MKSFSGKVLIAISKIPKGQTLTYKQVAEKADSPAASRAVGNILKKNYDENVPCHRVVRSDGATGKFNRGADLKIELLKKERASR